MPGTRTTGRAARAAARPCRSRAGYGRIPIACCSIYGLKATLGRMTDGYLDPELEAAPAFHDEPGARITEMDGWEVDRKLDVARIILRANQIERFSEMLKKHRGELDPSFAKPLDEGDAVDVVALRRALRDRTLAYRSVQKRVRRRRPAADADGGRSRTACVAGPVRAAGG